MLLSFLNSSCANVWWTTCVQFVHLTALELSYTPEPCNVFVKVRPVFHYAVVLQHNVHMYTLNTCMYF